MKPRPTAAVALLAAALLTACGISSGTITAKAHDDPYTYTTMQCMPAGQNACGIQIPISTYVDECWRLDLRDGDNTGSACVDQPTWDRARIGDTYPGGTP